MAAAAQPLSTPSINPAAIGWKPIPGTSQELGLCCPCDEVLHTGTRGCGKTETQLMDFAQHVGKGFGSYWRGVIFDTQYDSLADVIVKSQRIFRKIWGNAAKFKASKGDYRWVFPDGEELLFRVIAKDTDYWKYHGQEFPWIGFNELTKYGTKYAYTMVMSLNRSGWDRETCAPRDGEGKIPDWVPQSIPLRMFSTTNSYGKGHLWVKKMFAIDRVRYGTVTRSITMVEDYETKQDVPVERTRVAIFGNYKENPFLSKKYIAGLYENPNEAQRKSWLTGSWDITSGGAIDDLWNKDIHVVPRFKLPAGWRLVDRSMDWGSTAPFSVGWWVEADGTNVDVILDNGMRFTWCPQPGSLIQIAEWYGTEEIGSNKGIKMGSDEFAQGIIDREIILMRDGWISVQPMAGPADNSIGTVVDAASMTPQKHMLDKGVVWTESDKSPGTRTVGLQLLRDRLIASLRGEGPGIYWMSNCEASIATLPILQRDDKEPDKVDTDGEDHAYDMTKYRCLASNDRTPTEVPISLIY